MKYNHRPTYDLFKKFGIDNGFEYVFFQGWLYVICYGGTAFAIECEPEQVEKLMRPLLRLGEYDIIRHCNKNGWSVFDYYTWKVVPGIMKIYSYDENHNLTIVQ